ncbi:hypothetical protein ACQHIH_21485 (plasmid) [Xanthomonas sontii]|uniref:hypothetical protein n=1 Tax=Xanthomonas sontii TaxID=2650745 RepID=UPI003F8721CB
MSNLTLNFFVGGSAVLALVVSALAAVSVKHGVITRAHGTQKAIISVVFYITICMGSFLVRGS